MKIIVQTRTCRVTDSSETQIDECDRTRTNHVTIRVRCRTWVNHVRRCIECDEHLSDRSTDAMQLAGVRSSCYELHRKMFSSTVEHVDMTRQVLRLEATSIAAVRWQSA
jgi:hypothetical protein